MSVLYFKETDKHTGNAKCERHPVKEVCIDRATNKNIAVSRSEGGKQKAKEKRGGLLLN